MTAPAIPQPWRALAHPLWWGALLVLGLNDHVLKGAGLLPGVITGKLSDVAGLVVAPALLATLLGARTRRAIAACHAAPVLALAALKLVPGAAGLVVEVAAALGEPWAIVADPTDVLAAPAALVAWRVLVPRMRGGGRGAERPDARAVVLAALGALACAATSRSPPQAPTVSGDSIVVQTWSDGHVLHIDAGSGALLARIEVGTFADGPVVHGGAVWLAEDGWVRARDLRTGAVRWERGGGYVEVGPVDDVAVHALACREEPCNDPRWVAIDRATMRERWSVAGARDRPPVLADGVVAFADGTRAVVRDATTGAVRWSRTFGGAVGVLAVSGGVVWVVDLDGDRLHAIDVATGLERRRFTLTDGDVLGLAWGARGPRHASSGSSLAVVDDGMVRLLDANAPHPRWTTPGDSVAASGDRVLVSHDRGMRCLDAASGRVLWSTAVDGWTPPAIGPRHVALRRGDASLDVHDLATGRRLYRFALDEGRIVDDGR